MVPNEGIEIKATGSDHLSLQGKGGAGKSLVASILAQHLDRKAQAVRCIHPDPANKTRSEYKGLRTAPLQLFRESFAQRARGSSGTRSSPAPRRSPTRSSTPANSSRALRTRTSSYGQVNTSAASTVTANNSWTSTSSRTTQRECAARSPSRSGTGTPSAASRGSYSAHGRSEECGGPRSNSLCGDMLGPERPKIRTTNVRFSTGTKGGEHQ